MRLSSIIFPNSHSKHMINHTFLIIFKMLKNNGTLYTVKHLKQARLHITRYLCGQPLLINDINLGVDESGFPKMFIFMKEYIDSGNIEKIKFIFTLLNISRTIYPKKNEKIPINYNTITDPLKTKKEYIIPIGFIKRFVKDFNLYLERPYTSINDIFISTKAGPNGPSTLSAIKTLNYLDNKQIGWISSLMDKDLSLLFIKMCQFVGLYYGIIEKLSWSKIPWSIKNLPCSGRLSIVHDPECKERIIAISDYWSQLVLKPINDGIFKLLKTLPCDRTYTQDPCINKTTDDHFWSLDLTAATDRFPISLQRRLLEIIYQDSNFANIWKNLLTDREYFTPDGNPIKYMVGQPMGAYSSWATFTLTHHLVVQYCAYLNNIYPFNNYIILGDDIVIYDDKVAKTYIKVIAKLGVDLSLAKTHVSKDTYEFAKRWIKGSKELSGVPLRGLVENLSNPFIIYTILYDYFIIKKNLYMARESLFSIVCHFYLGFKPFVFPKKDKFNKIKFVPLKISKRFLIPRLRTFSWGLKLSLNNLTYDSLRTILAYASASNDVYVLPSSEVALSEMKRISGNGLAQLVSNKTNSLFHFGNKLIEYFTINQFPKEYWIDLPIVRGLYNHANGLLKISKDFTEDNISLKDAIDHMIFLDISTVLAGERNKILSLATIGQVSRIGLKRLKEETDVYFGSAASMTDPRFPWALGVKATDTYNNASGLALTINESTKLLISDLDDKMIVKVDNSLDQLKSDWFKLYL